MSTWEALTLHYKGRIQIKEDLATWLARATAGTREAPLTHEIALVARQLPLHQDPADRILAATAEVLDLTLVTADERYWDWEQSEPWPTGDRGFALLSFAKESGSA